MEEIDTVIIFDLEDDQKKTLDSLFRKKHKHLILRFDDIFKDFYNKLLAKKVISINDYLYVDRINIGELKNEFKSTATNS